ncbi:stress enhanced protein 1, chloroplastic isoform X2 [Primulina tabacum]|uniref:stress enhanced protein 1, chloroplastic isoform X2 n=1 Tax=Primulina tabacum TaxID=48773 RepID=UPI003F59D46A
MAAATQISSPLRCYASIRDGGGMIPAQTLAFSRVPRKIVTVFATGCPLLIQKPFYQRFTAQNSKSVSIRCEQNTKEGNGLDIWIGRLAMVGFTAAISIEIATGKGLLENVGLITPLPIAALTVTALVGVLLAVFIFQSASNN